VHKSGDNSTDSLCTMSVTCISSMSFKAADWVAYYSSVLLSEALCMCLMFDSSGDAASAAAAAADRMWARDDGSLVASPSEEAVEQAIEAVMCTTCHSECARGDRGGGWS
jgi:hypothetical protein